MRRNGLASRRGHLRKLRARQSGGRRFLASAGAAAEATLEQVLEATRVIPTAVKLEVWKRDKGRCVECGSIVNLHFDRIIPWSRGGSSLTAENVQLLCARHNLAKHDRIQ